MRGRFAAAAAAACVFLCAAGFGGEKRPPRAAAPEPPFAVVRLKDAAGAQKLLQSGPIHILGLQDYDYSGPVPGLGTSVTSVRELLSSLAKWKTQDIVYSLTWSPLGSGKAVFGCTWLAPAAPSPAEFLDTVLPNHGLSLQEMPRQMSRLRWLAAPGSDDLAAFGSWTDRKNAERLRDGGPGEFLSRPAQALSVWLNARPLFGALSLASGLDFRTEAVKWGFRLPSSLELHLGSGKHDGLTVRLPGVLALPLPDSEAAMTLETGAPAELRVTVQKPLELAEAAGVRLRLLALANLNPRAVSPEAAVFEAWRTADGGTDWLAVCRFQGPGFARQAERITAWLEVLAASPASGIAVSPAGAAAAGAVRRIDTPGGTAYMTVAEKGDRETFLLLAGSETALAAAAGVRSAWSSRAATASWELRPGGETSAAAAAALTEKFSGLSSGLPNPEALPALLAEGDSGTLTIDDETFVLTFRTGMTPLFAAAFAPPAAAALTELRRDPVRLGAARLRFLTEVCSEWRFRNAGGPARPMPSSFAEILADSDAEEWLDERFAGFPGHGRSVSSLLRELAAEGETDGFRCRIEPDGGSWALAAEDAAGRGYRLQDGAVLLRLAGETEWAPYADPLFGLGL